MIIVFEGNIHLIIDFIWQILFNKDAFSNDPARYLIFCCNLVKNNLYMLHIICITFHYEVGREFKAQLKTSSFPIKM